MTRKGIKRVIPEWALTVLVVRGDFRHAGVSFDIRLSAVGSGIEGEHIYLSIL